MHEFTGERIIPGLVDADLFNEHLSRYRFAASFIEPGMAVLDAGCGTGYGTTELARARKVAGVDISPDAVAYAAAHYAGGNTFFAAANCSAMPFADAAFDLVVSFEVIEHLRDYRELVNEARRVLKPGGLFVVSTPNRDYYAESRAEAGPNPFHVREFDAAEFTEALGAFFPHVEIWAQNHADAIVFATSNAEEARAEYQEGARAANAHFFVAVCGDRPVARRPLFAWIPSAANVLRERELHIAKLESLLADALSRHESLVRSNEQQLGDALARHESLQRAHEQLLAELGQSNQWAASLNEEIAQRDARIVELQNEAAERFEWVRNLQAEIACVRQQTENLNAELAGKDAELASRTAELESRNAEFESRNAELESRNAELESGNAELESRAESLNAELASRSEWARSLDAQLALVAQSRWVRLGRKLHIGPDLNGR